MKTRRHWMGALLLLAACGGRAADQPKAPPSGAGAYPPPPQPGAAPAQRPYSYELPSPSPGAMPVPGMPAPGPGIAPPPLVRPFSTPEEAEQAVETEERELLAMLETVAFRAANASQCTTACRALASMRRSVEGLCRLTGDADERCTSARTRLAEAGDRVREAGCTCATP